MSTNSNIDEPATGPENTSTEHEPSRPTTGAAGWVRDHRAAAAGIGSAAVAVLVAVAVGIPTLLGTVDHANADSDYQATRMKAVALYRADVKAQRDFATAHKQITDLLGQVTSIHDQAAAGPYLPAAQITALTAEVKDLTLYAGHTAGTPVPDPHPAGTASSSTSQLQAETARLKRFADQGKGRHVKTVKAVKAVTATTAHTTTLLTTIITGLEAKGNVQAVPALDSDARGVLAAWPKAGQGQKDQLAAAVTAAQKGVKDGKPPASLLLDYLAKADTVKTSQTAAEQAAAEQATAQQTAAQETARQAAGSKSSTRGSARGGASSHGPSSSGGGGSASESHGSSSGGGGSAPQPVDHTPHVITHGNYQPGCVGSYAYTQSTSTGGGIIINVDYPYTFTTFSTSDGWGLKVFDCSP